MKCPILDSSPTDSVSTFSSFFSSASSITFKNSSTVFAFFKSATKFSSISIVANLERISRCTLPEPSGAAIKKAKSTGLESKALYSTPPLIVIAARPGSLTPEHLP